MELLGCKIFGIEIQIKGRVPIGAIDTGSVKLTREGREYILDTNSMELSTDGRSTSVLCRLEEDREVFSEEDGYRYDLVLQDLLAEDLKATMYLGSDERGFDEDDVCSVTLRIQHNEVYRTISVSLDA